MRWWQQYATTFDRVILSAHYKEINLKHFTSVADALYESKVYVDVTVCMDPLAWDQCLDMVSYLKEYSKHKWYIGTQKIEEVGGVNLYTPEQLSYLSNSIKRYPALWYAFSMRKNFNINRSKIMFDDGSSKKVKHNQVQLNNWNKFYGWQCNIGIDMLLIDPTGQMAGSCGQNLYGLEDKFNIYNDNFITEFNPILKPANCKSLGCYCTPETLVTKSINFIK